jgi:hypothetical protein
MLKRAREPVVFPNQDTIEKSVAGIVHQLAVGSVILTLCPAVLYVAAERGQRTP